MFFINGVARQKRLAILLMIIASISLVFAKENADYSVFNIDSTKDHQSHLKRSDVEFYLSLYGFFARLKGDTGFGSVRQHVDMPFSKTWDNLDGSYMGMFDINIKESFGIYLDYQYVKTKQNASTGSYNVDLSSRLERASVGTYYRIFEHRIADRYRFFLEPTIGVHFTNISASLDASDFQDHLDLSHKASWNEPYIGTRFFLELTPKLNVVGQVDFGNKRSKGYQAHLSYRADWFNTPIHWRLGYRMIDQKHDRDGFLFDTKEHGPVLGVNIQF